MAASSSSSSSNSMILQNLPSMSMLMGPMVDVDSFGLQSSDDKRGVSPKNAFISRMISSMPRIELHHIPFKFSKCIPLGCTSSHVFAVIESLDEYFLVCSHLYSRRMRTPYQCVREGVPFESPWVMRIEGFTGFLGGCCFKDNVCVVTENMVVVFDTKWNVVMRNTMLKFVEVKACDMNDQFLVIAGTTRKNTAATGIVVFQWKATGHPIIMRVMIPQLSTISLSRFAGDMVFCHFTDVEEPTVLYKIVDPNTHAWGSFVVLGEESKWMLQRLQGYVLDASLRKVLFTKDLSRTSIVQVSSNTVVCKLEAEVNKWTLEEANIVDVITLEHDVMVLHDSSNAVRIYDGFKRELGVVTQDLVMGPLLNTSTYPTGPYRSIAKCMDSGRSLALFLNAGTLAILNF